MKTFDTHDVDLSAAIMTATGVEPDIHPSGALVSFSFPDDYAIQRIVFDFAAGRLILDVKRFANRRAWLFRKIKGVQR